MLPTCRDMSAMTQRVTPILARWVRVADKKFKMSWQFVSARADILPNFRNSYVEIYYGGMGVHTHNNIQRSFFHDSATSHHHRSHYLLDRHYNKVAEIMSSVCDWARLGLCLKPQGPASLIKCMEDGCNRVLHHMCQCTWESEDEEVRQAHGTRKYCAHHHPAVDKGQYHAETGPPSNLLHGFSQSTIETMSTITTATSLPPWGI